MKKRTRKSNILIPAGSRIATGLSHDEFWGVNRDTTPNRLFPLTIAKNSLDVMEILTILTVLSALAKFLVDGLTLTIGKYTLDFGHMDALSYATLLAPVLGVHGYLHNKKDSNESQ